MSHRQRTLQEAGRLSICFALLLLLAPIALEAKPREEDFLAYLDQLAANWQRAGKPTGEPLRDALEDLAELRDHALQVEFSPQALARLGQLEADLAPKAFPVRPHAEDRGTIRGSVREQRTGLPIAGVEIRVWAHEISPAAHATSELDGTYSVSVPAGRYFLIADDDDDLWATQRYRLLPCRLGDCDRLRGTPVEVAATATVDGIDFELLPAGRVVGSARRAADGAPIPYGRVELFDALGRSADVIQVIDGQFASRGLFNGAYFALMENTQIDVGQVFGGSPACAQGWQARLCEPLAGSPIQVVPGEISTIEFSLIAGGFISGTLFDRSGQLTESPAVFVVTDRDSTIWHDSYLSRSRYRAGPLPPGLYAVKAQARDLALQLYRDHVCLKDCGFAQGDTIQLRSGEEIERIDFHLHAFGSLSGRVVDRTTGAGIGQVTIRYFEAATRQRIGQTYSAADGSFSLPRLPPGAYLFTAASRFTEGRAHGDIPFFEGNEEAALEQATPFVVSEGAHSELPPLRLRQLGRISGRVVDAGGDRPIPYFRTVALQQDHERAAGSSLDHGPGGEFEIGGLLPGTYYILIDGPEGRDLLVGGNQACLAQGSGLNTFATCDPTRGTAFEARIDSTTDIGEIRLPAAATLEGRIQLAENRTGRVFMDVFTADGRAITSWRASATNRGDFAISLPFGTYYFRAFGEEHIGQAYSGFQCTREQIDYCLHPERTTPVAVLAGETRQGIDFDLLVDRQPCWPLPSRFCLGNGRFSVRGQYAIDFRDFDATATAISQEAGYFTFFDPANVEVVVKILNACSSFGRIWIYAAGLTDVSNYLVVRDHWAARTRLYPSSGAFEPFVDDAGFPTCDAPAPVDASTSPAATTPPALPGVAADCGGDPATSLCLGGRFKVVVEWTTAGGQTGSGWARPLTADTGFFYFFSPDNIEVVVKVLNACGASLNNRYWLFAAGMTDVAVTIRVEDTETGAEKIYLSPLGTLFQPILDFEAFASCP